MRLLQVELESAIVRDPLVVTPDTTVMDAVMLMSGIRLHCDTDRTLQSQIENFYLEARSSCVIALENKQVVGILTERDVIRLSAQRQSLQGLTLQQVMSHPVITLRTSALTDLFSTINLLHQHHIRHIPILNEQEHLIGLVTHESLRQVARPIDLLRLRTVSEVMVRQVIHTLPDSSVLSVTQQMAEHRVSSVVIVAGDRSTPIPLGIVTERDIVQFQALGLNLSACRAQTVMSAPVFTVKPSDPLWLAQQLMEQRLIHRLVVTGSQGEVLGIITQSSILQALNPIELYKLADVLEKKVVFLEAEKVAILETRASELEQQVAARTNALRIQAEREQLVAKIAMQIRSSLSLQTILDTTVEQIRQVLNCDRVNIWQVEAKWQTVVVAESTDSSLSLVGERISDTCFKQEQAEIYCRGRVRVVSDIHAIPMTDCHRAMLVRLQTRAKILVPLVCGDQLWGLINVTESQQARDWQPEEVELLKVLSIHLAIAIQQATTYQQLQDQLLERQQAEARLRESEQRYASLAAAVPVGIFRADAAGQCTYVNERWCQIAGLSLAAAVGNGWRKGIHPDDQAKITQEWDQSAQEERPFRLEYRFQRPDGSVSWVFGQSVAERDLQGQVIGYVGTITDISDRKQAEAALIQSEAQSRAILAAIPDFMFRVGADGIYRGFVTANRQIDFLSAAFDYTGLAVKDIMPPEVADRHLHHIEQALQTGNLQIYEQQLQIGDRIQDEEVRVVKSGEDEALFMIRDISDRKQAELERLQATQALEKLNAELEQRVQQRTAELQAREAQLEDFFENANDLIQSILLDSGRFEYVNRAWREVLGYSAEEVEALTIFDVLHPQWHEHCRQSIAQMQAGKLVMSERMELTFLSKTRQEVIVEGSINCRFKDDRPVATQAIFRDITARKQAEIAQRESQQLLQTVLDTFPLAVFWKDRNLVYLGANPILAKAAGLENVIEMIGKTDYDMPWSHTEADLYRADDRQVMETGIAKLGRIETLTHPDGTQFWIETNKIPLRDLAGNIIGVMGTFQDVSDRKRAEFQLQEQKQFLQSIYNGVDYPIFVIDVISEYEFIYIDWNIAAEKTTGILAHQIVGKSPEDIYGTTAGSFERERLHQCFTLKISLTYEECLEFPGRAPTWWLTTLNPLKDDTGKVYRIVGTTFDITDRKHAEQTIRRQADREKLLREITQRMRQSLDLQTIFVTACQEIRTVIESDRVGIFKFYPNSGFSDGEFVAESVVAGIPSVMAIRVYDHCFGENYAALYMNGRAHVVSDVTNSGLTPCHIDVLTQFQVRANLVIPLLCGSELWGLLCIHQCTAPRDWQPSEIDLTYQIANQLAIAIQQANLYEQIQADLLVRQQAEARIALQLQRQQTLGAIVQQIRESLEIDKILATVTRQVKEMLGGDRVIVFRLFPDGKSRIVEEAVSQEFFALKDLNWEDEVWSQDILDYYWQGQPRIVPDVMQDIWSDCLREYSTKGQIRSKIIAPILQDVRDGEDHRWVAPWQVNQLWGLLVIHACQAERIWQDSEAQLLQQIANQLAIAIQQANLFERLQQELMERQQAQQQLTASNQQLAVSNQELARATRLKDEFLANMSHELRTPLNAILGMTEGLQEAIFGAVNPQQIKALQTIERSGSHLLELINDILDVAKIEAGQIQLDFAPTAITHLCQSSLAFVKQQALRKQIQLEIQDKQSLQTVIVDERRIRQVLINLLNNAVKFTPEGGHVVLEIRQLTAEPDSANRLPNPLPNPLPNGLRIAVKDTGIGISPENIDKLFQPFIQIDSALNRQYTGTGLGLALVKKIVELHGGRVELTSKLGVGSCFTIDLPCSPEGYLSPDMIEVEPPNPVAASPATTKVGVSPGPLILLAEDNEANISTISSYLRAKGYQILFARNGQEAIRLAAQDQPDLILMDIQMPGLDGLEAIRQIRLNPDRVNTPIIAITALAMAGDQDRCISAGANSYLTKPLKLKQLVMTMQQLLETPEDHS